MNLDSPTTNANSPKIRKKVLNLRIDVCDYASIIEKVADLIKCGAGGYLCFSTVHMVMECYDDESYAAQVNAADFVFPDGMPMVWMQRIQGVRNASQTRGTTTMLKILASAERENLAVGFYGGRQTTLDKIVGRLSAEYPKLNVGYIFSPPFRKLTADEDAGIIDDIKKSEIDILFVGLGCPKQERWMAEHKDKLPSVVMLGVGAAFDFYAGDVRESPEFVSKLGLEWLFRLMREPKRLWRRYLILNPRFIYLAILQLLGLKKFK